MPPEELLNSSRWRTSRLVVRTRAEALEELRRPCGRFRSVVPVEDALRLFIAEKLPDTDKLSNALFLGDSTPLHWKSILDFLHTQNIIATPHFKTAFRRNDYPFPLEHFLLSPAKEPSHTDGREVAYGGFGGALEREEAMSKAIGEVLERYFLSTYKRDTFRAASYAELSAWNRTIDIRQFDFFLGWQIKRFPQFAFDEHSVFQWVRGREWRSGSRIYLPAQLVYWNYIHAPRDLPSEKVISMQTTSSSAGHFTRDEAVLSALLEAIERDAFLIYWLNNISPRVISTDTISDTTVTDFVSMLHRFSFEVIFLNTTSDFSVPTAACVIIDRAASHAPLFAMGSSAGFTLKETLLASAIEALSVHHYVSTQDTYALPNDYKPFTSMHITREERLCAWRGTAMAERIKFFLSGKTQSAQEFIGNAEQLDTPEKQLAHIVNECASRGNGYEIYTYEVRHPVLSKLGYHVVRVIVPELIPLHLIEFAAPLNARRLREVPKKIGHAPAKEFNPWPHPFP